MNWRNSTNSKRILPIISIDKIMVASSEQIENHALLSQLFLLSSLPTCLILRFIIVAPFGRHVPQNNRWWFGPMLDARMSWFLFESPNLIWAWCCCWYWCDRSIFLLDSSSVAVISLDGNHHHHLRMSTNAILMLLFVLHYINRSIFYPLRMNPNSQKVPLIVSVSATLVTMLNGYLQCFYLVQIESFSPLALPPTTLEDVQRWMGIGLFFLGMAVNIHSDGVLRRLRSRFGPSQTTNSGKSNVHKRQQQHRATSTARHHHAYYIPHSPFFTYVSCPNLGGEMVEWLGFAMASRFSLPSVAFFVYTAGNLIPRAISHHEWYRMKFGEDYPARRRWAAIPFLV